MAEVIRIAESAQEAGTQVLPQNVDAECALLGALMVDIGWWKTSSSS
jgi:hypothetical protein